MKKVIYGLVLGTLATGAVLMAPAARSAEPITFHTGSVGGLYMEPAVVWAEQWKDNIPGMDISVILGGSMTNPLKVIAADPNTAMGWTSLPQTFDFQKGTAEYADKVPGGNKTLRALWRANALTWSTIVARPGVMPDGAKTLGDLLKTKPKLHWALKSRGSGAEIMTKVLFETYGVTYDTLKDWGGKVSFVNTADAAKLIIDGHADVYINADAAPAAHVLDMDASVKGLTWIAVDSDQAKTMETEYGYIVGNYPSGSYSTLGSGLNAISYDHVVFVPAGMNADLVYNMAKIVLGNPQKTTALPSMKAFDPKVVWKHTGFPLHPGAEKAYKELGLMK